MSFRELNTLHHICELERTQLLTLLAMSVENPKIAGYLSTGNRSEFLYVEGSKAKLYDISQIVSTLYETDKGFDCILKTYQDSVTYIDPITRQIF